MNSEMNKEQKHFNDTLEIIRENVARYEERAAGLQKETKELYRAVQAGETELYGQLAAARSIQEMTERTLRKNRAALDKPYFGRVDFDDLDSGQKESLYIGKSGVSRDQKVIVVDWRAPVSSVYYENEMGKGSYEVPEIQKIPIDLKLKRTYDAEAGRINGYYDNDVASNDELLVKYLARNKDVVLGDIIATIQKEQNEIIRDSPYKNMIVQGVAGSGKTTVAMHRISYILYNFQNRIKASEFCIIGSNDMLLSYITSGLPELDVSHVRYMRMDQFFTYILGKKWKKSYKLADQVQDGAVKSRYEFARALDQYLRHLWEECLTDRSVKDPALGVILSSDNIKETLMRNRDKSVAQVSALLNDRIKSRIKFLVDAEEKEYCQAKIREYRKYYDPLAGRKTGKELYLEFLTDYQEKHPEKNLEDTTASVSKNRFDVYDAAALVLIEKRLTAKKDEDEFSQIVVDEAQDFGEMVYYVQKMALKDCYFTIMGDVSQNIHYDTGMNDWENLKDILFDGEKDSFYLLAKSYRNTIEISEFAGRILELASAGQYRIQPVIRHGKPVEIHIEPENALLERLKKILSSIKEEGYVTTAVICRDEKEAEELRGLFERDSHREAKEREQTFREGVMILPVAMTKGLEFDAVILWKPDEAHYGKNTGDAKLLYVAATRALHELYLLGSQPVTGLAQ